MHSTQSACWFADGWQEMVEQIVDEFRSGSHERQPWRLIPYGKLARLWGEFSRHGSVEDELALQQVELQMQQNTMRLLFNNIASGHESIDFGVFLSDFMEGSADEAMRERLTEWAISLPHGGWRISDYGLPQIMQALDGAQLAKSTGRKVKFLDRALHVTHMRSDLASWYVEGGIGSLDCLAA